MLKKDYYLQNLYDTLVMCELAIQNRQVISEEMVQRAKRIKVETEQRMSEYEKAHSTVTLIKAPEGTQYLGHTVTRSPILGEKGKMIERYELVLEADFIPCGCTYATDLRDFEGIVHLWETTGKAYLSEI